MKTSFAVIIGVPLLALFLGVTGQASAAGISDYSIMPPFVQETIKPNLLMMIDNSASMYDLQYQDTTHTYCANSPTTACTAGTTCGGTAYCLASTTTTTTTTKAACTLDSQCSAILAGDTCNTGKNECKNATVTVTTVNPVACATDATCSALTAGDTCNNKCNSTRQCYDTTYDTATTYAGYFDAAATYSYDFTNNKFTGGATMPGTCTYSAGTTKYLCVNTSGSGASETIATSGSGFVASGNFLNWLTASKFDIQKKILTGGKFNTTSNVLIAESRGCAGREFLKAVPGVSLTFSIRGGTPGGIGTTQSLATEYGQTYIEIYTGTYNAGACLAAMNDWMNVVSGTPPNLGTFQNDTKDCVGSGSSALNAVNMWNHVLHDCYQGMTGGAQGYSTNLNSLEGECKSVYATIAPSSITDPNMGISICSSVLDYAIGGISYTGYLGTCWNGTNFTGPCTPNDVTQMENYCKININSNPVIDPSSTAVTGSVASASIPGFVMQQGLTTLTQVGTLTVKVGLAAAPTGLIYQFRDQIRFGAMIFNTDGSLSECGSGNVPCSRYCSSTKTRLCYKDTDCPTGETCPVYSAANNYDSGKIIAFAGAGKCSATTSTACDVNSDCPSGESCQPSVGDHSTGLIKALDDVQATTWTPHAEAFYNAIAYFVKDATATTSSLPSTFAPSTATASSALPINAPLSGSDSYSNKNPIQLRCQQNNILLITDGASTTDQNSVMTAKVTDASNNFRDPSTLAEGTTCGNYKGSPYLHDLSYYAHHRNIFDPTKQCPAPVGSTYTCETAQTIRTYTVFTGAGGSTGSICNPYDQLSKTASNGGTTMYQASDPDSLKANLASALTEVAAGASSGTAASIVSNRGQSGANLITAIFYTTKDFGADADGNEQKRTWIGDLQNYWYYFDPYINNSTIREDTNGDRILDLVDDYRIEFVFDDTTSKTIVKRYQDNGLGSYTQKFPSADPDTLNALWKAGFELYKRDLTSTVSPRKLLINKAGSLYTLTNAKFSTLTSTDWTNIKDYLNVSDNTTAENVMKYVYGFDVAGYRSRTVKKFYEGQGVTVTTAGLAKGIGVWKLGDIITSTPKVQSNRPLSGYHIDYGDTSYESYIASNNYKGRGMVYVGANDGALHAINLGTVSSLSSGTQKAQLTGTGVGTEEWAFVPANALPYLKYLTMPDPNYTHLYYVDTSPVLFDASIAKPSACSSSAPYWNCARKTTTSSGNLDLSDTSWRSVVIGSMGLGGASRGADATCTDCVKAPMNVVDFTEHGLSSVFALDVTDPKNPSLMWEFSHPDLGYTTADPVIVRINGQRDSSTDPDTGKNGKWFAVVASGPTGPIETASHQFMGRSDKTLKFFIIDVGATPPFVLNSNYWIIDTLSDGSHIANAFGGSLTSNALDTDKGNRYAAGFYSTDVVYAGYVAPKTVSGVTTWTDGGLLRLMTKENLNPANWVLSKVVDGVGPVTASIDKLYDDYDKLTSKPVLWLYFGTGRYFFKNTSDGIDSADTQMALYGVKEPCYSTGTTTGASKDMDPECTTSISTSTLTNQSSDTPNESLESGKTNGWYINLDGTGTYGGKDFKAERVVTTPSVRTNGLLQFTTFKPTSDICGFNGETLFWLLNYATGGAPATGTLKGKVTIQLSTGAIVVVDLSKLTSSSFSRGGRQIDVGAGKPPAPPPPADTLKKPVKKVLHIQER
jgi:type IV pilus assembly protein PilY1